MNAPRTPNSAEENGVTTERKFRISTFRFSISKVLVRFRTKNFHPSLANLENLEKQRNKLDAVL